MTKIEWTEKTWNPICGCSKLSPGCLNCYAEKMACRLQRMYDSDPYGKYKHLEKYLDVVGFDHHAGKYNQWNGTTQFDEKALTKPLHWKKPRMIFVCSMGDVFHESVPFEWVDKVMAVIALCPQHTFQVLTKRPERMAAYFRQERLHTMVTCMMVDVLCDTNPTADLPDQSGPWPLPNLWLGVTAENQEQADIRIPILLQIPAAVRFVSVEPMLGPVDLSRYICMTVKCPECKNIDNIDHFDVLGADDDKLFCNRCDKEVVVEELDPLNWVICGGESGPKRQIRIMHNNWAYRLLQQCEDNTAFFMKQTNIGGKVCKDITQFPKELQVRQFPVQED